MGCTRLSSSRACAALALSVLLAACGGGGGGSDAPNNPPAARTWTATSGTAEKGPLITGSAVTAQELDATLSPTGKQYSYQISSDLGAFSPTSAFTSQYIGVSATGYYFDEVLGAVSSGPVTLNGYSDLSVDTVMNVNILTTLAYQRVRTLVAAGKSFVDARTQAEGEVLDAFNIPDGSYGAFGGLKISGNNDGAKLLAAISALFVEGNNAGEVSQLINNFQSDIGLDGVLENSATLQALATAAITLKPELVAANLNQRFASSGVTFTADDIARWVDGNGNGYVGDLRFEVTDANPTTVFTLPSWAVAALVGKPLSGQSFTVNGVSMTSVATVNAGDVISVRPGVFTSGFASASLNSGSLFDVVDITFLAPVDSIDLTPQGKLLRVAGQQHYAAMVHFADGSIASLSYNFQWTSSNPLVATVTSNGDVEAHSLGTTTITADFGSLSASATLEVVAVVLEDFAIASGSLDVAAGMATQTKLTGTYTDGLTFDVTPQATWHSVDPSVATVDAQSGVITGVALGTTSIEATVDSITHSLTVNVAASGHTAGPALLEGRVSHTATVLHDGRVLIAGGDAAQPGAAVKAEIYDSATGAWSLTGNMTHQHGNHEATLLADGRVIVTGGYGPGPDSPYADIYDPATNQWTSAATMLESRIDHTSSILPGGKVLVAGGQHDIGGSFASTEIYDPAANSWVSGPAMQTPRSIHTATVFANGTVLVAGGRNRIDFLSSDSVTATVELYDPVTSSWSSKAPMSHARLGHSATLLPDGRVLVTGGFNVSNQLQPPEIYDPVADAWTPAGTLATQRAFNTATLLANGKVMVAGGVTYDGSTYRSTTSVEVYDPATNAWSPMDPLRTARRSHTATRLGNDVVLIVGGSGEVAPYTLGSTELYW